jgi:hypothetical protein
MSLEQAKKNQPEAAQAQNNQGAPAPAKLVTKPISDPHFIQNPEAELRKLTLPVPADQGERDLFLVVLDKDQVIDGKKDEDDNNYQMYLGRSKSFKRGEGPDYYNTLVPLAPRCYATADRDPAQAVEVPEGWLYIIRQFTNPRTGSSEPELWRELKSDGLGNFRDVNLKRFEGKDQRRATGQSGLRIIVPYCIDKQAHDLWIAYSEVQWSWARVQSMLEKHELRNRRMHKLDLSDCLNNFAKSAYTGPPSPQKSGEQQDKPEVRNVSGAAMLYNLKTAPDSESKNLAEGFKEAIPVVYLDNPIGIGRRLAGEYQQQWQELSDCVNDLRAMPKLVNNPGLYAEGSPKLAEDNAKRHSPERWFEAAALANRYFYSKISKEIPPGVKDKDAYKNRLTEIEEQFIQYQNMLDKTAIEQAIRAPQRRAIREKLVQSREKLVDFLEKELAAIKSKDTEGETQNPPLVLALDDYFTLTPLGDRERKQNPTDTVGDKSTPRWRDNYLDGWGAVYNLVALLGKHEFSIDADLEANPKDGWDWRRKNPAFELLRKLADPEGGCPLHSRLFPKPAAGEPLKIDAAKVEDTATAFKIQHFNNFKKLNQRDGDICKGLNLFGSNFNELMAMGDKNDSTYEKSLKRAQYSVLRLIEGAIQEEFKETDKSLGELIAEAQKQLEGKKDEGIPAKEAFLKFAGFLKKTIDTADEDPTFAQPVRKKLQNIRVGVIEVVEPDRLRRLLYDLSDDKFVSSGLGGILGLVEIHNFHKALTAFSNNKNPDRNWELFAPLTASFLKIPDAIKDVKDAAVAVKKAAETAGRAAGKRSTIDIGSRAASEASKMGKGAGLIKELSIAGDLIDMGLTLSSFTENLAQNDDAAIADAIGFTGATLGLIGFAFSIPVLGWVAGLVGLAAWLAKAFLFKEDTPVELWIKQGPFARVKEYHEDFYYSRSTTIKKVKTPNGQWEEKACLVHRYNNFEFLVDSEGTLVHAGVNTPIDRNYQTQISPFKVAPDGTVQLKADGRYGTVADTPVATVGQPFNMHPLLQPCVKEKPKVEPKNTPRDQFDWKRAAMYTVSPVVGLPVGGLLYDRYQFSKEKFAGWQYPHEAYLALADAAYRPRVTMTEKSTTMEHRQSTVTLKVNLPFYIPGKSGLYIEFEEKDGKKVKTDKFAPLSGLTLSGSGDFEMIRTVYPGESKIFTANVRLDLLGDTEAQLPHEPLFCGSEIETKTEEKTVKGVQLKTSAKWIVVKKAISQPPINHMDIILNLGESGTRLPQA